MKRIIWHWTAGRHKPNAVDLTHYHYLIDGDGNVLKGKHPVSANKSPIGGDAYAKHTRSANGDSIGIALCAMIGAREVPFDRGREPITAAQLDALVKLTAKLCAEYGIPVDRRTTLSHAEVQPTLGIAQRGKWDIAWLPGMDTAGDPVAIGDHLRDRVRKAAQPQSWLAALLEAILSIFRGAK